MNVGYFLSTCSLFYCCHWLTAHLVWTQHNVDAWKRMIPYIDAAPAILRPYLWRANYKWNPLSVVGDLPSIDGRRMAWGIVATCSVVWVLWRRGSRSRPKLGQWMNTHFAHRPISGKSYTMLTGVFSHQAFWYLGCNSYSLLGFGKLDVFVDRIGWFLILSRLTNPPSCVFLFLFFVAPAVTYWMYAEQWRESESGIPEITAAYHFLAFFVAGMSRV